jgi:hypothetical protein
MRQAVAGGTALGLCGDRLLVRRRAAMRLSVREGEPNHQKHLTVLPHAIVG